MVDAELCSDSPFRTDTRTPSAVGVLPVHSSLVRMSPGMPSTEASCPSGAAHLPMASYARMSRTKPLTLIWDNSEGSSMGPAEGFLCNYLAVQLRPLPKPASLSPRRCCSEHLRTHHPHANLYIKCFPWNAMYEEEGSKMGSWSWIVASCWQGAHQW